MDEVIDFPFYEPDLFSTEALQEPFKHYEALRALGPVVRLRDPDVYVLSRFKDVRNALQAPETLICSNGTGFSQEFNSPRLPSLLQSDGEQHKRFRAEVVRPLLPAQLKQHRARLREMIGARVKCLIDIGSFEGMVEIARFLPVAAISELVGLPEEGRAAMLDWASAMFNAVGPKRQGSERDFEVLAGWRDYLDSLAWTDMQEGSWSRTLERTVINGRLSAAEARGMINAYVIPSLDTTILAQGHLLYNLAQNPDQWQLLRMNPALIPNAVVESVRHSSVVRWFSRYAAADYQVESSLIPKGARIMLIYASANRDERQFDGPDRFDILRDARVQLAWGSGPHLCGGLHLAKLEMEVLLEALIEHCSIIKACAPAIGSNRGLYGFETLPLELRSNQ